ncbi:MAG: hypothetical protein HZA54_06000, partial [Planctomycetes bacterium]|nr:hypothetical protein [Planctomycetota bacterium]
LVQEGIPRTFPWTTASVWKDRFFDPDLLLHGCLAVATRADDPAALVFGAKLGTAGVAMGIALAFLLAARTLGLRYAPLWTLGFVSAGGLFLARLLSPGEHLIPILLWTAGVPAILSGRCLMLGAVGFLLAWSSPAPHLLPALVLLLGFLRRLRGGPFPAGPPAAAALGVVAGLVLHPQAPNPLYGWWLTNAGLPGAVWGLGGVPAPGLGSGRVGLDLRQVMTGLTGAVVAGMGGLAALAWGLRPASERTFALAVAAVASLLLFGAAPEFVDGLALWTVLFGASAVEDQLAAAGPVALWRTGGARARFAVIAVGALLLGAHLLALRGAARTAHAAGPPPAAGAGAWLREHVPPGKVVMNLNVADFDGLFFAAPMHRYLCARDPALMRLADPVWEERLRRMGRGELPFATRALARRFDARYGVLNKTVPGQAEVTAWLRTNPGGGRIVYEDDGAAVFEVLW